jgi:short-subunit dehydrogenase
VHVKGLWYVTRNLIEPLKRRRGAVVNVSSLAGLTGVFGYTAYGAAKFAVIGFSEALRSEMKPHGVHVAVLCPPDTDTPQLARENETKPRETRAIAANTRVLSPDLVARALYAGLDKKVFLIIPGLPARFAARIIRYFPGIMRRFMDRTVAKVRESKEPGGMRSL